MKNYRLKWSIIGGKSHHVSVQHSPLLNLSRFSLTAWVKLSAFNKANKIIEKGSSRSYWLDIDSSGKPVVGFYADGRHRNLDTPHKLRLDSWYFLAGTFDGTSLKLYINAVLANGNDQMLPLKPQATDEPLIIGWKYQGPETDHLTGFIAQVRIYNRALSEDEIQHLYDVIVSPAFR